jgi:uncharacterized membrane protein YczE
VSARLWRPSPRELVQVVIGLTLFGMGEGFVVASELGNSPWSVFAEGLEVQTPLTIGAATFVTSVAVLLCWIPLGERRLGLGTLLNALIIAAMIDVTLWFLPALEAIGWRWAAVFGGIALVGVGSGLYLTANLGPGPRDGLMTGIHARTGWPIWAVRTGIETSAVAVGFVLGGTVGAGSLLFALLVGPAVATALRVSSRRAPAEAPSPTARRTAPGRAAPASAPRD